MSIIKPDTARFVFDLPAQDCSMDQFDEWAHRERYYLQVQHSLGFEEPKSVSPGKLFYDFLEEANALEEQIDEMREWCFWYRTDNRADYVVIGSHSRVRGEPSHNCSREEFDCWAQKKRWKQQRFDLDRFVGLSWDEDIKPDINWITFYFKSYIEESLLLETELDDLRKNIFIPRTTDDIPVPPTPSSGQSCSHQREKSNRKSEALSRLEYMFFDALDTDTASNELYREINEERAQQGRPPYPFERTEEQRQATWDWCSDLSIRGTGLDFDGTHSVIPFPGREP